MRILLAGLLAATVLSSTASAQMAPFGSPSEPLTKQEKAEIRAEALKAKQARAAAAERARQKAEAALAAKANAEMPEPVISAPVTPSAMDSEAPMAPESNMAPVGVAPVPSAEMPPVGAPSAAMPPVGAAPAAVPPLAPADATAPAVPPLAPAAQ